MKLSMNFSNLLKTAVTILFSLAVLTSCDKDDLEKGGATFKFTASYLNSGTSATGPVKSVSSVNNGELSNGVVIESFKINIKEIEFEFDKSENSISEMFMKTILVKGTIDGTPFIFWHDDSFDVEIEFDYNVYLDEAKDAIIIVSLDIVSLFDPEKGGIDISHAKDYNGNGIIEIYPDDPDGNEDLADKLMDRLEDIIDAFEEMYDN